MRFPVSKMDSVFNTPAYPKIYSSINRNGFRVNFYKLRLNHKYNPRKLKTIGESMIARRKFLKNCSMALMTTPALTGFLSAADSGQQAPSTFDPKVLLPRHLSPGDTIGLISPAGAIYESEPYAIAIESLQAMGLKVKEGKHLRDRYGHLAGSDEDRAKALNNMFKDDSIQAIIAVRGGSGSARILDMIDYDAIAKNPKIFIGYSDITALHTAIYAKTGLVTFHGPIGISSWNPFSYGFFRRILFDGEAVLMKNPPGKGELLTQVDHRIRTIHPGKVSGVLAGGNLSVLTGIMGSAYLPDWENKILFLEEVGEAIYRVDRMMSQLKLAGVLDKISGFVFGKCTDCDPGSGYGSLTLEEVIDHYITPLKIPAYSGAMIGHIDKQFTVPIGIEAEIDAEKGTIQMLRPAVQ